MVGATLQYLGSSIINPYTYSWFNKFEWDSIKCNIAIFIKKCVFGDTSNFEKALPLYIYRYMYVYIDIDI